MKVNREKSMINTFPIKRGYSVLFKSLKIFYDKSIRG
jgi:hypothetical protein